MKTPQRGGLILRFGYICLCAFIHKTQTKVMKSRLLSTLILLTCMTLFVNCSKKTNTAADCANQSLSTEFQSELNAITNATTAYASAQTPQNCQNLKDAYQGYIDALRDWEDCASLAGVTTAWQSALDGAEDTLDGIC